MYKSKLQEICQQKAWRLPEYNSTKQGLDHNPRFSATVKINGRDFTTAESFRTSKEAQNDAARLAFHHFTAPPEPRPNPRPNSSSSYPQPFLLTPPPPSASALPLRLGALSNTRELHLTKTRETKQLPQVSVTVAGPEICATGSSSQIDDRTLQLEGDKTIRGVDVKHMYKNQLQYYAQKRNLALPIYSCEREGPPHASRFKCTVSISGQTYQGQEFLSTMKDAENAAAKVALISLLPNGVQEDNSGLYKNLLQELLQKDGLQTPTYSIRTSGEPHRRTFLSTVEIEEESFAGEEARSKKLAELSAAKVAYNILRERKSSQIPMIPSLALKGQGASEILSSNAPSNIAADLVQAIPNDPMILIPNSVTQKQERESSVAVGTNHYSTTVSSGLGTLPSNGCVPVSPSAYPASQNELSETLPSDRSCRSDTDSFLEPPAKRSATYSNKGSVHPQLLNMEIPEGCSRLPVSDENWVALSHPK